MGKRADDSLRFFFPGAHPVGAAFQVVLFHLENRAGMRLFAPGFIRRFCLYALVYNLLNYFSVRRSILGDAGGLR